MKKFLKTILTILVDVLLILIILNLSNIHKPKSNLYWESRLSTKYYRLK